VLACADARVNVWVEGCQHDLLPAVVTDLPPATVCECHLSVTKTETHCALLPKVQAL
jgi:hypothetical protein